MKTIEKPFIIPVFIPHAGCPHHCAFCNQKTITHVRTPLPSPEEIASQIRVFLAYRREKRRHVQVSFYGGNFLGLPPEDIRSLLVTAGRFIASGHVDSLRFSTRPDTITPEQLDLLKGFPVSTVEIGVQSMDDRVLALAGRGHTAADTQQAVACLKKRGYEIGLQMMVGLPGDTHQGALATGRALAALSPAFVRIYPTVVLENSLLARWFREGKYIPLSLDAAVTLAGKLCLLFGEKGIRVIRMGLQASEELDQGTAVLAGPYHPAFGHLVRSEIFLNRAIALIRSYEGPKEALTLAVHPRNISGMRGLKNKNVEILRGMFHIKSLKIRPDDAMSETAVRIRAE